jgi:hypothetical protein
MLNRADMDERMKSASGDRRRARRDGRASVEERPLKGASVERAETAPHVDRGPRRHRGRATSPRSRHPRSRHSVERAEYRPRPEREQKLVVPRRSKARCGPGMPRSPRRPALERAPEAERASVFGGPSWRARGRLAGKSPRAGEIEEVATSGCFSRTSPHDNRGATQVAPRSFSG